MPSHSSFFLELFAGDGGLSAAVRETGVPILAPQDWHHGGAGLLSGEDVDSLLSLWREACRAGRSPIFHLTPPYRSFSRACDRSNRTRLRSRARPWGFEENHWKTAEGNAAALRSAFLVRQLLQLGGAGSVGNPANSYLWQVFDEMLGDLEHSDVHYHQCMFGAPIRKPTRLRVFGDLDLGSLGRICTRRFGKFACGRRFHLPLGFGGVPTSVTAAYPRQLCKLWAACIQRHSLIPTASARLSVASEGRVLRHRDRGATIESKHERHLREDAACTAGLRNPAAVVALWPQLREALRPVRRALGKHIDQHPELCDLATCCGSSPSSSPPDEHAVAQARLVVARVLRVSDAEAEHRHPASPLRYRLFHALQERSEDADRHVPEWLEKGAPLGLRRKIPLGGHFPVADVDDPEPLYMLESRPNLCRNHPSFQLREADGSQPALLQLKELVETGFGRLYADQAAAEYALGTRCYPAPLGDVTKRLENGPVKHRLIQDLRRNQVNACASVPERQVLPRFADHASDLAVMSMNGDVETLILDFKNAFMTIPANSSEAQYNCCLLETPVRRARAALDPGEPSAGRFVVWRVLGFGGRTYPLLWGRVSSMVSRATQALLHRSEWRPSHRWAPGMLQTYVDDPALVAAGPADRRRRSFSMAILFWLTLGIPLSWCKGSTNLSSEPHVWIGVRFQVIAPGRTLMTLPQVFVEALLRDCQHCLSVKHVAIAHMRSLVGRAARVSHILPLTRPFTTALHAALSAASAADQTRAREAPPGRVACRRFAAALQMMVRILGDARRRPVPLTREVLSNPPERPPDAEWPLLRRIEVDASPWGGGAVLFEHDQPTECFALAWRQKAVANMGITVGESGSLTFFEVLILILAVDQWASPDTPNLVLGDNTAALQEALALRGRATLAPLSQCLAIIRSRRNLLIEVAHLYSEANSAADALSRLSAPGAHSKTYPFSPSVRRLPSPKVSKLWDLLH